MDSLLASKDYIIHRSKLIIAFIMMIEKYDYDSIAAPDLREY